MRYFTKYEYWCALLYAPRPFLADVSKLSSPDVSKLSSPDVSKLSGPDVSKLSSPDVSSLSGFRHGSTRTYFGQRPPFLGDKMNSSVGRP